MLTKDAIRDSHNAKRLNLELLNLCKNIITIMIIALVNTMRFSVHRVIKLLTLVQDSSMEQKPELFPSAKVQRTIESSKSLADFLFLQHESHNKCDRT